MTSGYLWAFGGIAAKTGVCVVKPDHARKSALRITYAARRRGAAFPANAVAKRYDLNRWRIPVVQGHAN